jgi:hypothetical protein
MNGWPGTALQKQRKQHNANRADGLAGIGPLSVKTTDSQCDRRPNFHFIIVDFFLKYIRPLSQPGDQSLIRAILSGGSRGWWRENV